MARGEGVKKISDLFASYKKRLRAPQKSVVIAFIDVVQDVCEITLKESEVSYTPSSHTISLRVPGQIKTEILFQKEEIILHLKGRLGVQSAPTNIL